MTSLSNATTCDSTYEWTAGAVVPCLRPLDHANDDQQGVHQAQVQNTNGDWVTVLWTSLFARVANYPKPKSGMDLCGSGWTGSSGEVAACARPAGHEDDPKAPVSSHLTQVENAEGKWVVVLWGQTFR